MNAPSLLTSLKAFAIVCALAATSVSAIWPDYVGGKCEKDRFYCASHLEGGNKFPHWVNDAGRQDGHKIWKCAEDGHLQEYRDCGSHSYCDVKDGLIWICKPEEYF